MSIPYDHKVRVLSRVEGLGSTVLGFKVEGIWFGSLGCSGCRVGVWGVEFWGLGLGFSRLGLESTWTFQTPRMAAHIVNVLELKV